MLTIEIEGAINKMLGGTFYEVYKRTSKAKRELDLARKELEELGMKVDVVYLSDKERQVRRSHGKCSTKVCAY